MNIREALQRVQSAYSKGLQSDDTRLSNRHVYNKLITLRSKLITQEINKNQKVSQWNYQTISCIGLELVPVNECPCSIQSGCLMLRSIERIPPVMVGKDRHIIQSVTGMEGRLILDETTWIDKKYKGGNKYTSKKPDWFERSDKIWVTVQANIGPTFGPLSITALFNDPLDVYNFMSACGSSPDPCADFLDEEFPIDGDLFDAIIELAATELIDRFTAQPEDTNNNAEDDISGK